MCENLPIIPAPKAPFVCPDLCLPGLPNSLPTDPGQTAISKIERGRKSPTLDTYARLLSALELKPTWALASSKGTAHSA